MTTAPNLKIIKTSLKKAKNKKLSTKMKKSGLKWSKVDKYYLI
jgi:hypothetical protein